MKSSFRWCLIACFCAVWLIGLGCNPEPTSPRFSVDTDESVDVAVDVAVDTGADVTPDTADTGPAAECTTGADCDSGVCEEGQCLAPTCEDGVQNGGETAVDCGGDDSGCKACETGDGCAEADDCVSGVCEAGACAAPDCEDGVSNGKETDVDCGGPDCEACSKGASCSEAGDCASRVCQDGSCVAAKCGDGVQNGSETDVDCGGPDCGGCGADEACQSGDDCTSEICEDGVCRAPTCSDGIHNGNETDADCGGNDSGCKACAPGDACKKDGDCASDNCDGTTDTCAAAACDDGIKNGQESDTDCGGMACAGCKAGQQCNGAADCDSGVCKGGACAAPSCSDGVQNGGETDRDCGGVGSGCDACSAGSSCSKAADCRSRICDQGSCVVASCTDGVRNGGESDVDCGGPQCTACSVGDACDAGGDCASSVCQNGSCVAPTCNDQTKNGQETDVDCGGAGSGCPGCRTGGTCSADGDCTSGVCKSGSCKMPTCSDGVQNGQETDVDCGGTCATACSPGDSCKSAGDCSSGVCNQGVCQTPDCHDRVQNGQETDVDCGGASSGCMACAAGAGCSADGDCVSGVCKGGTCRAPSCSDGTKNGQETDVDCGGPTCNGCGLTKTCGADGDCKSGICNGTTCAVCRDGDTQTKSASCGYKSRGTTVVQTCKNGKWVDTGCRGVWYTSCKAIQKANPGAGDGTYKIDPDGPNNSRIPEFSVTCNMTVDGGGWTVITPCTAKNQLRGAVGTPERASHRGFDSNCRPWTYDNDGFHTHHYTFEFPAGYAEFRLHDYHARANSPGGGWTSDMRVNGFVQTDWSQARAPGSGVGDISFGTPDDKGPLDSFARHVSSNGCKHGQSYFCCTNCQFKWTWTNPIKLNAPSKRFRIGWGERGGEHEGWYPWWSGTVWLR